MCKQKHGAVSLAWGAAKDVGWKCVAHTNTHDSCQPKQILKWGMRTDKKSSPTPSGWKNTSSPACIACVNLHHHKSHHWRCLHPTRVEPWTTIFTSTWWASICKAQHRSARQNHYIVRCTIIQIDTYSTCHHLVDALHSTNQHMASQRSASS